MDLCTTSNSVCSICYVTTTPLNAYTKNTVYVVCLNWDKSPFHLATNFCFRCFLCDFFCNFFLISSTFSQFFSLLFVLFAVLLYTICVCTIDIYETKCICITIFIHNVVHVFQLIVNKRKKTATTTKTESKIGLKQKKTIF